MRKIAGLTITHYKKIAGLKGKDPICKRLAGKNAVAGSTQKTVHEKIPFFPV
jgi:hypothetical protein